MIGVRRRASFLMLGLLVGLPVLSAGGSAQATAQTTAPWIVAGIAVQTGLATTDPQPAFVLSYGWVQPPEDVAMIRSFDVRVSRSSMTAAGSSPWTYPETLMSIPAHPSPGDGMVENARVRLPVAPGQALCASARARDAAGNVGDWSPMSCAVRFLDDGSLRRHGPVRRLHDHHYSGGRATALRGRGELVLRGAQPNSIVAVLTSEEPRRSRRSYVVVRVPGHRREVDACLVGRADVRTRRYSVASACRATARWGPIRLRSSEGSLSAAVDGVALLPRWTWPAWLEPPLP